MKTLYLKPGREKSLLRRHPWVFSGAAGRVEGHPGCGDTVRIVSADGRPLALAAYSPNSLIRARVWTFDTDEHVDADFIGKRLRRAIERRQTLGIESDGQRLVYAESDGLPGMVVDRYGEVVVVQLFSCGAEAWREAVFAHLKELLAPSVLFERSDADVRTLEGLPERSGPVFGKLPGEVEIIEHGLRFSVDVAEGHKTGFYLDQRDNRQTVGRAASGRRVLNCFSYSGGFTVHALAGGAADVVSVDSSGPALAAGKANVARNGQDEGRTSWLEADVFQQLRRFHKEGRRFDLIILDPPKFAPTASHAARAARGYKDINLQAFRILEPGGLLATFSCSGGIDPALFQKIVADAALDAGCDAEILSHFHQAADHPIALAFPEANYLKGLLVRRL